MCVVVYAVMCMLEGLSGNSFNAIVEMNKQMLKDIISHKYKKN